jgi:hypothetical protein
MKRLNLTTNLPFKRGDIREDGFIFKAYAKNKPKSNGYFTEYWASPESFKNSTKNGNRSVRERYCAAEGRAGYMLRSAEKRAKKNGALCTIDKNWIIDKIKLGRCEFTNIPFDLNYAKNTHKNPYAPSLDRIDSKNKNYSPENTRIVLYAVNCALNEFGIDSVRHILQAMIENK